jgi:hypothetical protein
MRLRGLGKATVAVAVAVGGSDESMAQVVVGPAQMRREALCDGACSGRAEAGVDKYAGVQRASAACSVQVCVQVGSRGWGEAGRRAAVQARQGTKKEGEARETYPLNRSRYLRTGRRGEGARRRSRRTRKLCGKAALVGARVD